MSVNVHSAMITSAVALIAFNAIMTVAKRVLDKLAPASKADSLVGKILKVSQTAVEFASANSSALPSDVQSELKGNAK